MLKHDYLVVKIGVDTAENEPFKSGDVLKEAENRGLPAPGTAERGDGAARGGGTRAAAAPVLQEQRHRALPSLAAGRQPARTSL